MLEENSVKRGVLLGLPLKNPGLNKKRPGYFFLGIDVLCLHGEVVQSGTESPSGCPGMVFSRRHHRCRYIYICIYKVWAHFVPLVSTKGVKQRHPQQTHFRKWGWSYRLLPIGCAPSKARVLMKEGMPGAFTWQLYWEQKRNQPLATDGFLAGCYSSQTWAIEKTLALGKPFAPWFKS